jgi:hypothetical protein
VQTNEITVLRFGLATGKYLDVNNRSQKVHLNLRVALPEVYSNKIPRLALDGDRLIVNGSTAQEVYSKRKLNAVRSRLLNS